jgi:DNA-binding MarR family transcriptional regulator
MFLRLPSICSRAIDSQGYKTREHMEGNRKNIYVRLTPAGKALKRSLIPMAEEVNAMAMKGVPDADIETTRRALLVMLDNLTEDAKVLQ